MWPLAIHHANLPFYLDIRLNANDETIMKLFWNSTFASHVTFYNIKCWESHIVKQCIRCSMLPRITHKQQYKRGAGGGTWIKRQKNVNGKQRVCDHTIPRNIKTKQNKKTQIDVLAGMITVLNDVVCLCVCVAYRCGYCKRMHTICRSISIASVPMRTEAWNGIV